MSTYWATEDDLLAPSHDPYDLWATRPGVAAKKLFYKSRALGFPGAAIIGLTDWFAPRLTRKLAGISLKHYPISFSLDLLSLPKARLQNPALARWAVEKLEALAYREGDTRAWGLGFSWISKNGLYKPDTPFVTHTPYAMEALLQLMSTPAVADEARTLFEGTWPFLRSLKVMDETQSTLALSYAPVHEPRIVINSNAYAAMAFSLHARHGKMAHRAEAEANALRLCKWVTQQQDLQGRWMYYADTDEGNFCDAFHSGFVIKNLFKTARLVEAAEPLVAPAIKKGIDYWEKAFTDTQTGLIRRFSVRDIKDPYRWDLYDQSEYLGMLIDTGRFAQAQQFAERVTGRFHHRGHWYCRIDMLGRRWGRNFRRWGIAPWQYQRQRLDRAAGVS